jgi:hypothetical protein
MAALVSIVFLLLIVGELFARQGTHSGSLKPDESKPSTQTAAPTQPIPFSHKTHAAFQIPCQFCHPNPDPGNQMTIPIATKCMECHAQVAKDKQAIQTLAEFAKTNQPIPWVRLYAVPSFVYWSHRTHSEANIKCEMCHGQVAEMTITKRVTNVSTMGGCVECHKNKGASTGCVTCHEGLTSELNFRSRIPWYFSSVFNVKTPTSKFAQSL